MNIEYIKMCREAYPYLKGFIKENTFDAVWCNGWNIFCQPFGSGTNYTDFDLGIEPPMKDIERFRILRQEDLQNIYKKIKSVAYDGDILYVFNDWVKEEITRRDLSFTEMWLCFVMELCFNKQWNSEKEEWEDVQ